jgi:non-specific serine/threonine protein kinase
LREQFEDAVWFVDLSPLRDADHVVTTIGQVLGVRETGGRSLLEMVRVRLRDRPVLLVLDNFEHVLQAAAQVTQILADSPHVRALVTSREPMRIRWEHVHIVQSLATPRSEDEHDIGALASVPAVMLFTDRAHAADSSFRLNERNAAAVAELCRRSDRLPLALELAAPHVRWLTPIDILRHLASDSGRTSAAKDTPARHQSLNAAIAWSYELLDPEEQSLFRRISVFAGGFTAGAAEAVASSPPDVLGTLASLVDKSLVAREATSEDETHFHLLETIGDFARQRLTERGEESSAHEAHAAYFLQLAERAAPELEGPRQASWLERLQLSHDNLRAALRWSLESRRTELGLRLAPALWRFWWMRGYLREGQRWLDEAISRAGETSPAARAKALNGAGNLAAQLHAYERSTALHEESLALRREMGDRLGIAISLHNLALTAQYRGDYDSAITLSRQALTESKVVGDRRGIALALMNLGECADHQGDHALAQAYFEQSLPIMEELEDGARIGRLLSGLAWVAHRAGDDKRALVLGRQGLRRNSEAGDQPVFIACLEPIALALCALGQYEQAMRLLGAATYWRELNGMPRLAADAAQCDVAMRTAFSVLGEHAATTALQRGRMSPAAEVLDDALSDSEIAARTLNPARVLTRREEQVAALIARGRSNRQIADELVIATSTAERHVANILRKLDLTSRAQIAVWATDVRSGRGSQI